MLIAAIIAAANALVLAQMHRSTLEEVQDDLLRQSLTLSELVEHTFRSADLVLANVAEKVKLNAASGDLDQLTSEEFHVFLVDKKSELPQIDALAVLGPDGERLSNARDWPLPKVSLAQREYFVALRKDPALKLFISAPLAGIGSGHIVVILARPVLSGEGRFLGVVLASTAVRHFEDLFAATSLGKDYAATLVRADGVLLAGFPAARRAGMPVAASILAELGASRSSVSRSVDWLDPEPRIAATHRLLNYPLATIVTQSERAAFGDWRRIALTMAVIAALMIIAIAIAACFIARSWKQQDRLEAARADVVEAEKTRVLAEAELNRQRDLAQQSMRLNAAIENMNQGLCMFDRDSRLVVCNRLYAKIYQLPPELVRPGTPYNDIVAYRFHHGALKGNDRLRRLALTAPYQRELASRIDEHADGTLIRITRQPLADGGWVSTHEDITNQQRAADELDETKRFLDSIIENVPVAVVVKDARTLEYLLVNRAFETMLDLTRTELLGRTSFDLFPAETAQRIRDTDVEFLRNFDDVFLKELEIQTPKSGTRIQATKRIAIRDSEGVARYLVVVIDDITERRKAEQRIAFLAHHDPLTGLANRAALTQKIDEAAARQRRRGEPFSVLLLDLDRFKHVNDTLGHPAGDTLLTEVAGRLKELLRETDTLARLGGDEFAIVQAGEAAQREAATALANRIIDALGKPFVIEGGDITIGASIGIALAPEHDTGSDNLLKMADLALYRAKSAGRNGYRFFDPEMSELASARHETEIELRRAIAQGELELHYQPIVETKTRKVCSAEALVRWRHPSKGLIYPDRFIALAEETGLITQIGEWVLRTACAEAAKWPADVKVAVNLSLVQFHKADLAEIVMRSLHAAGLAPERLELEITETALIESAAECLPTLRHFKSLGITIVLDDFGTGYSSLSQLAMFPFDKIKIDKSFTQNLTKRSECAAIIGATLTLAQTLNIATTAEGVETAEQYRILRLAGVTSLQGYLFKRPGPAVEIVFDQVYGGAKLDNAA